MADLENGLWAGNNKAMPQEPIVADYVTAMVKGKTDGCACDACCPFVPFECLASPPSTVSHGSAFGFPLTRPSSIDDASGSL
eukprot:COSAG02_NODE_2794_length_8016_cov_5.159783_9_plen_82_part_00